MTADSNRSDRLKVWLTIFAVGALFGAVGGGIVGGYMGLRISDNASESSAKTLVQAGYQKGYQDGLSGTPSKLGNSPEAPSTNSITTTDASADFLSKLVGSKLGGYFAAGYARGWSDSINGTGLNAEYAKAIYGEGVEHLKDTPETFQAFGYLMGFTDQSGKKPFNDQVSALIATRGFNHLTDPPVAK